MFVGLCLIFVLAVTLYIRIRMSKHHLELVRHQQPLFIRPIGNTAGESSIAPVSPHRVNGNGIPHQHTADTHK
ncbi:hypothetical protein J3F84DRAFT_382933 [Trichoderma pleuroticola]